MKQTLLWIWCLPQNLVGLFVKKVTKAERNGDHYVFENEYGSVSLGEYIFINRLQVDSPTTLRHEKGHRTQSRILGWLYIGVILIPSLIHAATFNRRGLPENKYYDFYTEKWADKIAGIERR